MKLLFLCQSSPLKEGGAETRNREVARHLAALGHQVTVLCAKTSPGDPAELSWEGVRILQKKVLPDFLLRKYPYPSYLPLAAANLFLAFHLLRLLRKERFDALREDISPVPPSGLLALIRFPGIQRSAIVHNLAPNLGLWFDYYGRAFGTVGYLMNRLLRGGWLRYDAIVCDGKWFAEELQKHAAIANRVEFIPNGVGGAFFDDRSENRSGARILAVGRLVEIKGHRFLLEALARIAGKHPELRLSIYGGGPLREALIELGRELGIADRVSFEASRPSEAMPEVYRGHDLFVMPSLFEGLPLALLEAMAGKLPVLVSDISAFRSVLDERSALFFTKADSEDLAAKLSWALEHRPELTKMTGLAQSKAHAYRWENISALELAKMVGPQGKEARAHG
ncbi:MAG TPA: glycosyltransferase family 4 protein [bacterium]|nr:glycosyltransferase family 4 protein [bacterium]